MCFWEITNSLEQCQDSTWTYKKINMYIQQSQNNIFLCLDDHLKSTHLREQLSTSFPGCKIKSLDTTTEGYACTCEIGINDFNVDTEQPLMVSPCDCGVFWKR